EPASDAAGAPEAQGAGITAGEPAEQPSEDTPKDAEQPAEEAPEAAEPAGEGRVNINTASYEDLRALGLSVTQTGRVLAYRERTGGFTSLDELDQIPGFPREQRQQLRERLAV